MAENTGIWLKQQAGRATGMSPDAYGFGVAFIERLREYDCEVSAPLLSRIFQNGLNSSVIVNPELLSNWSNALDCTVNELLTAHGYKLDTYQLGELIVTNEKALYINQLIERAIRLGDEKVLDLMLSVANTMLD